MGDEITDDRWHPYPAETPTEMDDYLVTKYSAATGERWRDVVRWHGDSRGWPDHIVAWRPLPEPWTGDVAGSAGRRDAPGGEG